VSPPLYGLDIETDTTVDGLDPSVSPIVAVAVATPDGDRVFQGPEDLVLHRTDELMSELDPGIVVTWNGSGFDLPFLTERARRLGVTLGLDLWDDGPERTEPGVVRGRWYAHDHLDGYRLYRADVGRSLRFPCGLKAMARLVGLPAVEVDASRVHLLSASEVRRYVTSDARVTRQLVQRRWPAAATFVDLP